ncbi:MAG: carbamoyl-phosphate synthase (glutamine-hydrolyzing) small subunit, partial [Candidatus Zixiibacteriota bacterium]
MPVKEQVTVNRLVAATGETKRAVRLILEDGTEFSGYDFGHHAPVSGEVVFTTGMVGYPETLSDPSYRGQIVVFTYPLVGNYGVPAYNEDRFGLPVGFESTRLQAAGVVVSEHTREYSHYLAKRSLEDWLSEQEVPGLYGIDTRALTQHLRSRGAMLGKLVGGDDEIAFSDPNTRNLAAEVMIPEVRWYTITPGAPTVLLIDCGCKANIIRSLLSR